MVDVSRGPPTLRRQLPAPASTRTGPHLPIAEQMKVHPASAGLVIGNRDMEANAVSLRVHGIGNVDAKPRDEVLADILQSIKDRHA
jgi:hypothetical protein